MAGNESINKVERVWPNEAPSDMPSTSYPDLAGNPSIDIRSIMNSCDTIARKHWWDQPGNKFFPTGEGNGPGSDKPAYAPKYPNPTENSK